MPLIALSQKDGLTQTGNETWARNVLTGLAKRIVDGCETVNLGTAAEVAAFVEAG